MKILIVNSMSPFIWGGAEELATHLQKNLVIAGHEAEILRIPFQWEPFSRIPSQMLMVRAFELWEVDRVIALKFPAYLIRHPQKTLWLLHQYRQAYDLFDAKQSNIPCNTLGDDIRSLIKKADNESFLESKHIFTNSQITRNRLLKYNDFDSEVLPPPINDPELFIGGKSKDYIFAGGRVNSIKRQYLLLEALQHTSKDVKLIIAGPPDSRADAKKLEEMVEQFGLSDRVKLDLRFLPRTDYATYLNQSTAVAYIPFDEDSLGYVAMEAAIAGKALITTHDSGGILGLVTHEQTGWVAEPTATSLAEIMSTAWTSIKHTQDYGIALQTHWQNMNINWPSTIEALLR